MAARTKPEALPAGLTMLQAMDDPRLFGPFFKGKSWDPWRAFLAALTASPMTADQLEVYKACTGRIEPPTAPFREAALVVGRRGGKSRILALLAVYVACFIDHGPHLAAGEVATVACVAADRRQARTVLRYVLGLLKSVPTLAALIEGETAESVTLSNRVVIEVHTASFRVTRGYTLAAFIGDEIAFWPAEDSASPDIEIIRAVRPGLGTLPHSLLLLASSPYGKSGVLWQTYQRHFGRDDAPVLVWQAPTAKMNPSFDRRILEEAAEEDPEAAAAEYEARFRDDVSAFVAREVVDQATIRGLREIPPASGIEYVGFVDPSGGSVDAMTLAIAHRGPDGETMLDLVREVRAPFSPDAACADFAEVARDYGLVRLEGDKFAGEWPRERFAAHGINYQPTAKAKSEIYREFLPLLNGGAARLLDIPRLSAQLCGLQRRVSRGGRDSIDHSPGAHDDLANAVAGALVLATGAVAPSLIRPEQFLRDGGPVELPPTCQGIFAAVAMDKAGQAAIVWFAGEDIVAAPPLFVIDFEVVPFGPNLVREVAERSARFARNFNARYGDIGVCADPGLVPQFAARGVAADPFSDAELAVLTVAAAEHIAADKVKVCAAAHEKARNHPLGAALSFRFGDGADVLSRAVIGGIVFGLVNADDLPRRLA